MKHGEVPPPIFWKNKITRNIYIYSNIIIKKFFDIIKQNFFMNFKNYMIIYYNIS